jgi:hypothetical protein
MARKNDPFETLLHTVRSLKANGIDLTSPNGVLLNNTPHPAYDKKIMRHTTDGFTAYFKVPMENGTTASHSVSVFPDGYTSGRISHLVPSTIHFKDGIVPSETLHKDSNRVDWDFNFPEKTPFSEWSKKPLYGVHRYSNGGADEEMSPEDLKNSLQHRVTNLTKPHVLQYYHDTSNDIDETTPWHEYNVKDETFRRRDPLEDMFNL